jgi:acyl-CoA dehydrogenase
MTISSDAVDEVIDRVIRERWDPSARRTAGDDGWAAPVWSVLAETGLAWVSIPEEHGGSGGTLHDALAVLWRIGAAAVPLPFAETSILGGWLLGLAGIDIPSEPVTVANGDQDSLEIERRGDAWHLRATLRRVAWARRARLVVVPVVAPGGEVVVALDPSRCQVTAGRNLAGEPRDRVEFDGEVDTVHSVPDGSAALLRARGALSRAVLLSGAMEQCAAVTVRYANQRTQFGKPIASFQSVAQHLVRLTSEGVAAALATEVAASMFEGTGSLQAAATAKSVTSHAAGIVAAHAHQAHGAIGLTQEYELHPLTRRLWSWRKEYGSERYWNRLVGREAWKTGPDGLWASITTGLVA